MNSLKKHICLILNDAFSMVQFRGGLISHLVARGHVVTVIVPPAGPYRADLERLGAEVVEIDMARFISPGRDIRLIIALVLFFARRKFDIVHTMTIKPNLYAAPIARIFSARRVVGLVSGAGFILTHHKEGNKNILSTVVKIFLRGSFLFMHKVWFQNREDLELFTTEKICTKDQGVVIRGSGVDLDRFSPDLNTADLRRKKRAELGLPGDCGLVLMGAARRIGAKGVLEFAKAAAILHQTCPDWKFVLVAPDDPGTPDAVYATDSCFQAPGLVLVKEFRSDLDEITAASDIVVLPSYYPEGVPRFLLEGLACGKPIVTTDHTGCRETLIIHRGQRVEDRDQRTEGRGRKSEGGEQRLDWDGIQQGKNGFLVPVQDASALAKAVEILIHDPELRSRCGKQSRILAEQEFSQEAVCQRIVSEVYEL